MEKSEETHLQSQIDELKKDLSEVIKSNIALAKSLDDMREGFLSLINLIEENNGEIDE